MTVHEWKARGRKAAHLAAVLSRHGATAAEADALPQSARLIVAELAGVKPPSVATWACVVGLLEGREISVAEQVGAVNAGLAAGLADGLRRIQ